MGYNWGGRVGEERAGEERGEGGEGWKLLEIASRFKGKFEGLDLNKISPSTPPFPAPPSVSEASSYSSITSWSLIAPTSFFYCSTPSLRFHAYTVRVRRIETGISEASKWVSIFSFVTQGGKQVSFYFRQGNWVQAQDAQIRFPAG